MTRIAYFDCLSGISGDMTLGALVDLGADVTAIESAVRSMGLPELSLTANIVKKCGFRAVHVKVDHPDEHAHRHLHHIHEMIDRATEVDDTAKNLAKKIFQEVAVAEAKVHHSTLEKVHFHEVGAVDSIADIVGTAVAMGMLGIERVASSPVPTGTGFITIAHGRVSIPAPATADILRDVPIAPSDIEAELTTPTGAAILKATCGSFGPMPAMTIRSIGYGAGTRDLAGQANVLRVLMGDLTDDQSGIAGVEADRAVVLETNIDDSTAEQVADCAERLFEAGALDVFQTPCTMKKGRAAIVLSAIVPPSRVGMMEQIIFEHTSSIGIRRQTVDRHKLIRRRETIETKYGPVRGKVMTLPGGQSRLTIEDDDACAVAKSNQTTTSEIRREAIHVWMTR